MSYVIVDTEYTTWPNALETGWASPDQHREIVQIAAIIVDDDFDEVRAIDLLVEPTINSTLSELFIELTGITQKEVDDYGVSFAEALDRLNEFAGTRPPICMNADEAVFRENARINEIYFNGQFHRLRPFLESLGIDLTGMSSGDLHKLTDTPISGHTHNALHDVRSMATWLRYAKRRGWFTDISDLPTGAPLIDPRSNPQV